MATTPSQPKTLRGPVKLEGIHSSGRCIASLYGKNCFLDFGIPGEEVTFILERRRQSFRLGHVVEIVSPSPHRTQPFCVHYYECGGCPWQHITYPHQLKLKHTLLYQALKKYEITTPEIPAVLPSPAEILYRHRVEYSFANTGRLGFHKNGQPGQVIDIEACYLQQEPSRSVCTYIKEYALSNGMEFYNHQSGTGFLRSLSIRNNGNNLMVVVGFAEDRPWQREQLLSSILQQFSNITSLNWTIHSLPKQSQLQGTMHSFGNTQPYIYEKSGDLHYRIHASSFYQPNASQAGLIYDAIRDQAALRGHELVYDLYTGVGTIALRLAPHAAYVLGIEGTPAAIEDAKFNAESNNIPNAEFMVGDILETFNTDFIARYGKPDVIVLDPPRSGTLIEIKKTINASGAGKVIYLSCNPVSLAFDLKQLTEKYRVVYIQPFDMLPHTHHLETLVVLEKLSGTS
jgi:23S rRNA (uracil1939-C5)-methyltransferase